MVIFHGYVSLPEGTTLRGPSMLKKCRSTSSTSQLRLQVHYLIAKKTLDEVLFQTLEKKTVSRGPRRFSHG